MSEPASEVVGMRYLTKPPSWLTASGYAAMVGLAYEAGYWGTFRLNVAEYAALSDYVSLAITPLIEAIGLIAALTIWLAAIYHAIGLVAVSIRILKNWRSRSRLLNSIRTHSRDLVEHTAVLAFCFTADEWGKVIWQVNLNSFVMLSEDRTDPDSFSFDWVVAAVLWTIIVVSTIISVRGAQKSSTKVRAAVHYFALSGLVIAPLIAYGLGRTTGNVVKSGGASASMTQVLDLPRLGIGYQGALCLAHASIVDNQAADAPFPMILIVIGHIGDFSFFYNNGVNKTYVRSNEQLGSFEIKPCVEVAQEEMGAWEKANKNKADTK